MDKTVAGLLGALGAFAMAAPASASVDGAMSAGSYRDLLRPIPNAAETLRAMDAPAGGVELAQIDVYAGQRHSGHHHHNRYVRPQQHHHHRAARRSYHHHHNNYGQRDYNNYGQRDHNSYGQRYHNNYGQR